MDMALLMIGGAVAYCTMALLALLVVALILWPFGVDVGYEVVRWTIALGAAFGAGVAYRGSWRD